MTAVIHGLLRAAAATHPDRTALVDGSRRYSYRELDVWSDYLAGALLRSGVRRGDRVGIHIDKSAEAVAAIYGVLKAGACYVPLDPGAPASRLELIAKDSAMTALLTDGRRLAAADAFHHRSPDLHTVIDLDDSAQRATRQDTAPVEIPENSDDLAYILYTSGSTGQPKGVTLTHGNGLAFINWAAEEFALTPDDRLSSHAPLHFDLSTFDLFAAAASAATLVLVPTRASVFIPELVEFVREQKITVWYSVPTALTMLVRRGNLERGCFPDLRVVLFAGEVMPTASLRALMNVVPRARFVNLYGPTETNVCTWHEVQQIPERDDEPIPIGRGISQVTTRIVADDGSPVGPGEVGELLVEGPTVMRGYWNDEARTARVLIPPTETGSFATYRTGDMVRADEAGVLQFIGRRDHQIKSRGHRIELGEIELALQAHPAVVECAVIAVPDEQVTNLLWAYVVVDRALNAAELIRHCREKLPKYMTPDRLEFLQELPKTSTGKNDRNALETMLTNGGPRDVGSAG
ncbi:amino acid adenylation domain-containing protein [Couchioplanes caeruleus]|uniref:L-prolyl-[peptidyl carrier protein] synthetase n=1 Tax=Couchioplanes caeruleus TaxID=56438 RepID=A0A3N1GM64_9ACTN|nr:amino acid adenylation domain-containing protein [Couchioplanes caeruleus]ROP31353.1 L-prolyl-[peptidyl carrier protein] synthetase [Couchioplanes caeruleus]